MLYLERKRLEERDAAEAAGADLWTEELDKTVRGRLLAFHRAMYLEGREIIDVEARASGLISLRTGLTSLDLNTAIRHGEDSLVLTWIGAIHEATDQARLWELAVSEIFESHRIKFKFVDGEIIPLGSEIMHADVVEPALVLLHGRPEFINAEKSFRDALEELAGGTPDDAITDAGSALQQALEAVGCKGHALGELIKDAKINGWFGPRDSPLADSIAKIHNWVAAERNAGEAHRASEATKDDAWFVVHVVGAAIVRLAAGPRTDS